MEKLTDSSNELSNRKMQRIPVGRVSMGANCPKLRCQTARFNTLSQPLKSKISVRKSPILK